MKAIGAPLPAFVSPPHSWTKELLARLNPLISPLLSPPFFSLPFPSLLLDPDRPHRYERRGCSPSRYWSPRRVDGFDHQGQDALLLELRGHVPPSEVASTFSPLLETLFTLYTIYYSSRLLHKLLLPNLIVYIPFLANFLARPDPLPFLQLIHDHDPSHTLYNAMTFDASSTIRYSGDLRELRGRSSPRPIPFADWTQTFINSSRSLYRALLWLLLRCLLHHHRYRQSLRSGGVSLACSSRVLLSQARTPPYESPPLYADRPLLALCCLLAAWVLPPPYMTSS
jgi:hypothetical protein